MAKFHIGSSNEEPQLIPEKFTIDFLLGYSKALNIMDCKMIKFDIFIN